MLEEKRQGARQFWEDSRHAYCDIRDAYRSSIRELLSPDHAKKYDRMLAELDQKQGERAARLAKQGPEGR